MPRIAAAALPALILTSALSAQLYPDVTPTTSTFGVEPVVSFDLTPVSGANSYAMLVCYASISASHAGKWEELVRATLGAVNHHEEFNETNSANQQGNSWAKAVGADATAPITNLGGALDSPYTIPPEVVASAIAEIQWPQQNNWSFVRDFPAAMQWPSGGWNSPANTMNWDSLVLGTGFEQKKLLRVCLERQIGLVLGPEANPQDVQVRVDAVMRIFGPTGPTFDLSAVLVEFPDGQNTDPTTPRLRLSRTKKITIQTAGSGGEEDKYYDFGGVYPGYGDSLLKVKLSGGLAVPVGDHEVFLPTLSGYVSVPGTVVVGTTSIGIECYTPFDVITGPFAIWNAWTGSYALMCSPNGPTYTHFFFKIFHQPN